MTAELGGRPLADVLHALAAVPARAAAPARVDQHAIAHGHASCLRAEGRDGARGLVPERERERVGERALRPLHDVQVAVAQACGIDLEQHFARAGLRGRDLD